ncbi:GNAT family N-acetyltransferase [Solibacillus daqui]|uniref:GNAT family N-acetyltransferase n=1 Tax=Solibacillus daqui TaxID=2912187 RepID=UPI002365F9CB|nr:GNAT family N-acetyltransferase [Solibacillus daqui]
MLKSVTIKELTTIEQIEEASKLEHDIWAVGSIPVHQTIATIRTGGIVLGAYLNDELIGFNYSCPGYMEESIYLYSHMLGIKRNYREQGVGELLKIYLKDLAIDRGYRNCRWTFDPLEARNGFLNFTKLRSHSDTYIENCYGEMEDPFNRSLPTDRLWVEWQLVDNDYLRWDAKVDELIEEARPVVECSPNMVGLPTLDPKQTFRIGEALIYDAYLLPIPTNFQKIKVESPALAEDWRYKTRHIMQEMFKQGYKIIHLIKKDEHISHYVLVKRTLFAL